jgi:RND family efflux transporter MFP subunit
MAETSKKTGGGLRVLRLAILTFLGAAILGGAIFGAWWFVKNKPTAKRRRQGASLTPVVEAVEVKRGTSRIVVSAMGTVIPARMVTLKPRVGGEVVKLHPNFVRGGLIRSDESLVQLDEADYRLVLAQRAAALISAQSELKLEEGQQDIARREWKMLSQTTATSELDSELTLRKPQKRAREAAVAAASAQLEKAKLDLTRTVVHAPFNAVIRETSVEMGDQATTQTGLATLVGTDSYWVEVTVPVDRLKWIVFPANGSTAGSTAVVRLSAGGTREGRVLKLLSDLEPQGRLARVLIEIPDPLDLRNAPDQRRLPVLLGEFVNVDIKGRELENVLAISRESLRDGSEVWLLSAEDKLVIKPVQVLWADRERVLIGDEFANGLRLITSNLGYPVDGMGLRLAGEEHSSTPDGTTLAAKGAKTEPETPEASRKPTPKKIKAKGAPGTGRE